MPTDVIMPQMGESIFEGTITKWLKKPGDSVERDEPLFEISTDKVDAEIPSPASGVLKEIKAAEGATVQVNTIVGVIDGAGSTAAAPPAQVSETTAGTAAGSDGTPAPAAPAKPATAAAETAETGNGTEAEEGERVRSSPLVRRIAREHGIDLSTVPPGSGSGGRINKEDILSFIAQQQGKGAAPAAAVQPQRATTPQAAPAVPTQAPSPSQASPAPMATGGPALPGELVAMSKMRAIIAQRMVESKRTSAHVHTVFKVDMTRIVKIRDREKGKFEQRNGVKLTFMPFISRAVITGIKTMPIVNTSVEGDSIRYHAHVNLGIAVALDWGLIVPVVKQAEERSFLGLQRAISDVAERARAKKLQPDEVQGGTFTITNPGIFGPQFGTPIINQPQVAILGVGGLFKEPVVMTDKDGNDSIAIRHIVRLTLGYDHRIIDGADADKFMVAVRSSLENWSEEIG